MNSRGLGQILAIFAFAWICASDAWSGVTDPNTIWPLCGRITENPPPGWVETDGCPSERFGDPAFSDEPLSSTFGPRPLASENNRYDFHRGVDIATPIGTPFFAIADGTVEIVGEHPSYSDPLIRLRHFRPGETSCNAGGCYNSFYLHISGWVVAQDQAVVKGQLLGYTGASGSSFEHLHFEVRDAPDFDPFSAWQRDSVHPLRVVPYAAPNNTTIQFNNVDFTDPLAGSVDLTVTSNRYDLVRLGLTLLDGSLQPIPQPGDTPDARGYHVAPAFFDMDAWNFQYTHKDSSAYPWSSFGSGGVNECPYHADHGASYAAGVHMDQQDPADFHEGLFNGLHVRTQKYWPSDTGDYTVDLEFLALEGDPACVQATASFASGDTAFAEWGSCGGGANQPPSAAFAWSCQGADCDFDASASSDPDGSISSYAWDFGEGNVGNGVAASHNYAAPGSYDVTLTVTDNDGASDNVIESVSVSNVLLLRGPYLQMQSEDGIQVRWRTDVATDSVVRYGASPDNLDQSVTVAGSRTDHEVSLASLGAAQQYYYSIGDSVAAIGGDVTYRFATAPAPGSAADTRIWVLGDSGTANADARAVRDAYKAYASADPADFIIMLGDNAYNDGTDAEYQAAVFDTYPVLLRQLPLVSTLGNHDGHTADSATQSGPYYDIFSLPTAAEMGGLASGTEAYYSFDYANIHFICLDSYDTSTLPGSAMLNWLESDLALNTQPWVIAFWHHPPYSKGSHNSDTEGRLIDMRQNVLPVLEDWGVDLVMTGHSHSYERSYLLDGHYGDSLSLDPVGNVLDPGDGSEAGDGAYEKLDVVAAIHAGAVYAVAGSSGKISGGALNHPAMFVSLNALGSMIVDVSGDRMDLAFLDDSGAVRDAFTMLKTPDTEPPLLTGAAAEGANSVKVDFNETLDALEAGNAANYAIAGLAVNQAELLAGDRSVRLTTSAMTPDAHYTLVVNNVQDLALNSIAPDSQVAFDFFETMTASFQDSLAPDPGYDGTADAYIREASPTTAYGLDATLQVDGSEPSGSTTDMSIVLAWDVSSIPADATVLDAVLGLQVTNASSGAYQCYALLATWEQSGVTWNDAAPGVPWGAPGASSASDRGADVLCTVTAAATGSLTVPLTAAGLAQVQAWVSDPSGNHGLIIANPSTSDGADFHSSESSTVMSRPKLTVTYRVPTVGNNQPSASFSYGTSDLTATFTDTSSDSDGSIVSWAWDFGDGNGSSSQHPAHAYAAAGSYTVGLTVTDDDGASDSTSQSVTVSEPANNAPSASFSYGTTDLTATFTDTSSDSDGSIVSWSWDFGDGNGSASQNPAHAYAAAGSYTVGLTVTDDDGASDSTSQSVTVSEPAAGLSVDSITPSSSGSPNTLQVTVSGSGFAAGASLSFSGGAGPAPSSSNVTVLDANTLTATVTIKDGGPSRTRYWDVTVTNPGGASATLPGGFTVTVGGEPPANNSPSASFSYGTSGLTATFTDSSTDSDGSVVNWSWDFGDGNGSTSQNPSHAYAAAGTYTVSLTVTDDDGASNSTSQSVTVTDPTAGLSVDSITPNSSVTPNTLQVTVSGSGFVAGASLSFSGGAGPTPTISGVTVVDGNTLTATVTIRSGGPSRTRTWDVTVSNPDGTTGTLVQGFVVIP